VPLDDGSLTSRTLDAAVGRFHEMHRREFRYAMEEVPVETYILRVSATGPFDKPTLTASSQDAAAADDAPVRVRNVYFGDEGFVETKIFDRLRLRPGAEIEGPAIIEQFDSTTVLPPGATSRIDDLGNIMIKPAAGAGPTGERDLTKAGEARVS
jgi:N-methylhydantoinase A